VYILRVNSEFDHTRLCLRRRT